MGPRPFDGPLPAELVCAATLSRCLHPDDLELAEKVITWRLVPEFPEIGRSAWVRLAHPFEAPCGRGTQLISSLKLKGVGLRDHRGDLHHPSNAAYRRPDAHLGIDEHGRFRELRSAPAPKGALALNRAIVEYATARELTGAGPISEAPLLIYRYPSLEGFRDDAGSVSDLAVVVAGLPAETSARADNLVHYARQSQTVQTALRDWAAIHTGDPTFDWARAQTALWREYGRRLREFHDCGFYRHNAHSSNLGLGSHGVFLVDLDSTRHMLECAPRLRALQAVRDVAGGVFHVIADTIRSGELSTAGSAAATHRTLVDAFLRSYFPDAPDRAFEEVQAEAGLVTSELWAKWIQGTFGPTGWAHDALGSAGVERAADLEFQDFVEERHSRIFQIDMPALFCRLMPGLTELYSRSGNAYEAGAVCPNEVGESADVFLRKRRTHRDARAIA